MINETTYLGSTLEVLRAVPIDVVVGTDGLLELVTDDEAGALGSRSTCEEHDTGTSVGEGRLKIA